MGSEINNTENAVETEINEAVEERAYNTVEPSIPKEKEPVITPDVTANKALLDMLNKSPEMPVDGNKNNIPMPEKSIVIKNAVLSMITSSNRGDKLYVTFVYTCRTEDDKLITVNTTTDITEEELDSIKAMETYFDNLAFETQFTMHYLRKYNDSYLSKFDFSTVDDKYTTDKNPLLYTEATNIATKESVKLVVSPELFMSFTFINNYILASEFESEVDLQSAMIGALTENPADTSMKEVVDLTIDKLAPAKALKDGFFKKAATSDIVLKLDLSVKDSEDHIKLVTTFNVGEKFNAEKFNGTTSEDIIGNYLAEDNEYITSYMNSGARIENLGKEFLLIKSTNKNNENALIMFDEEMQKKLIDQIKNY